MPSGDTPTPAFEGLAYGENEQANRLSSMFPVDEEGVDEEDFAPQGDEDAFLFSQTDRPSEPLTAGAPFGEGPDMTPYALENEEDFADRVAEDLMTRPGVSKDLKAWAQRRRAGV